MGTLLVEAWGRAWPEPTRGHPSGGQKQRPEPRAESTAQPPGAPPTAPLTAHLTLHDGVSDQGHLLHLAGRGSQRSASATRPRRRPLRWPPLTWSRMSSRSSTRIWLKRVSWVTSALVCSPVRAQGVAAQSWASPGPRWVTGQLLPGPPTRPPLPAQRTRGQAAAEAGDLLPTSGPFRLLGPPHLGWSGVRWSLGRKGKRGQRAGTWRGAWLARGRRRDRDRRPESRNKDGLPGGRRRAATASGAERASCPNPSGSRARQ